MIPVRVRAYTLTAAARRIGVSERTVRSWVERGQLAPLPGVRAGRHRLYGEPDLVRAERANRAGRTRRTARPLDRHTPHMATS